MPLTSVIADYDERWPRLFLAEAKRLRLIFGSALVNIHHVGSTAVKGLAAKPEIDILVTVRDRHHLAIWRASLANLGYRAGGDVEDGHHFFKRDVGAVRTHKVHICEDTHPKVQRMLSIRDRLRDNDEDRAAYAALKRQLEAENETGMAEYLAGKAPFLDDLYARCQAPSGSVADKAKG